MGFSVFSFSINSFINLLIALLPVSVLEQTPLLKQEGLPIWDLPLPITSSLPSALPKSPVMLFYSVFQYL